MIVRTDNPLLGFGRPTFYSACLICGWCSKPQASEMAAGDIDDKHLACKLAARRAES